MGWEVGLTKYDVFSIEYLLCADDILDILDILQQIVHHLCFMDGVSRAETYTQADHRTSG